MSGNKVKTILDRLPHKVEKIFALDVASAHFMN